MPKRQMPDVIRSTISKLGYAHPRGRGEVKMAHFHYKRNGGMVRHALGITWTPDNLRRIERAVDDNVREIERSMDQRRTVSQWIADVERYISDLDDPTEARAELAAWAERYTMSPLTLFQAIERYVTAELSDKSAGMRRHFKEALITFFGHDFPDRPLNVQVLREHFTERARLLRDPSHPIRVRHTGRPYSPVTINNRAAALSGFFNFCVPRYMSDNPMRGIRLPEIPPKRVIETYSTMAYKRILVVLRWRKDARPRDAAAYDRYVVLFAFLRLSGLRIQEALKLRWADAIDDPREENHITATTIEIRRAKNKGDRSIPFAAIDDLPEVIAQLRALPRLPGGWVFTQQDPKPVRDMLTMLLVEARVKRPGRPLHAWRRTAINLWREQGMPENLRNYLAGHQRDTARADYEKHPSIESLIRESRAGGFER